MDWEPVIDGDFLPTNPVTEDSFADAGRDIPLLIGSNLNEWTGFFPSDPVPVYVGIDRGFADGLSRQGKPHRRAGGFHPDPAAHSADHVP